MRAPLISRDDLEFAAVAARDLHGAAARHRPAGEQFREHAIADLAQVVPVGVADREQKPDHHPEHRGLKRLRDPLAEQREHRAADEDEQGDLVDERCEVAGLQSADGALIVAQDQRQQADGDDQQQNPESAASHRALSGALVSSAPIPCAARRCGSSVMIRSRSLSLKDVQRATSSSVRPQPRHNPERGSMMQTLVQGEAMAIGGLVAIRNAT